MARQAVSPSSSAWLDPVLFSNDTRMRNAVRNSVTIFRKYGQHARRIDRLVEDANARTEDDAGCWRRGAALDSRRGRHRDLPVPGGGLDQFSLGSTGAFGRVELVLAQRGADPLHSAYSAPISRLARTMTVLMRPSSNPRVIGRQQP
jgi:hypothetical protein